MSLKSFGGSVLVHLLILLFVFCLGWFTSDNLSVSIFPPSIGWKDDSQLESKIEALEDSLGSLTIAEAVSIGVIENLEVLIFRKSDENDSLRLIIKHIRKQSEQRREEFDVMIAEDSARVVEIYRLALENLGVIPNMSERLTFREIGHGAKFLSDYQGMQLELYEVNQSYKALNENFVLQRLALTESKKLVNIKESKFQVAVEQRDEYKAAYESVTGFWKNRIIIGIGYGGQFSFNNDQVTHGVQIGVFFKIWDL